MSAPQSAGTPACMHHTRAVDAASSLPSSAWLKNLCAARSFFLWKYTPLPIRGSLLERLSVHLFFPKFLQGFISSLLCVRETHTPHSKSRQQAFLPRSVTCPAHAWTTSSTRASTYTQSVIRRRLTSAVGWHLQEEPQVKRCRKLEFPPTVYNRRQPKEGQNQSRTEDAVLWPGIARIFLMHPGCSTVIRCTAVSR